MEKWGYRYAISLVALSGIMQVFSFTHQMIIPWSTADLWVFALLAVVGVVWLTLNRSEISRWSLIFGGSFVGLICYAILTVFLNPKPVVDLADTSDPVVLGRIWSIALLATALVTMLAAAGFVAASKKLDRLWLLLGCAVVGVVFGFASWPRHVILHRSTRFASGIAGASILHVLMLLFAAIGLGWWLRNGNRRWLGMAVGVAGLFGVLATGSRAGMLALALWVVLLLGLRWLRGRRIGKRVWIALASFMALVIAVILLLPEASRLTTLNDPKRATNAQTAFAWWTSDWHTILFGTGFGRIWPWLAFESGKIGSPGSRMIPTSMGDLLLNPHSTFLGIATELGVVGLLLFSILPILLVWALVRLRGDQQWAPLAAALLASMVPFWVDTYLLRNFQVSFWWWVAAFMVLRQAADQRSSSATPITDPGSGETEYLAEEPGMVPSSLAE